MKSKLTAIFDNKATWGMIGMFTGSLFGENVAAGVNAFGAFIMAVL